MPRNENESNPAKKSTKVADQLASEEALLDTTVALESEPFIAFEQWIDQELDKLVARWLPYAAPSASLRQHNFGRHRG